MRNRNTTLKLALATLAVATFGIGQAQAAGGLTQSLGSAGIAAAMQPTAAANLAVGVAGTPSQGEFGDPGNTVMNFNVGAGTQILSVDWDITLTANDPSWLSEMQLVFTDSGISTGVIFTPGLDMDEPGMAHLTGTLDLVAEDLSFAVGSDGVLRLEFVEAFTDDEVTPNGVWNSGTVTFHMMAAAVPEPSSYGLMALGLAALGVVARRRKTAD